MTAGEERMDQVASALNAQYIELETKYSRTSDLTVLREALSCITKAVQQADGKESMLANGSSAAYLANLARCHFLHYKATGDLSDLDEAIKRVHSAIQASPEDAFLLHQRCYQKAALEQVRLATDAAYRANEYIHVARAALASRLAQYFEFVANDDKLIEEAMQIRRELEQTIPKDVTLYGSVLFDLGGDYRDQYPRFGNLDDLDSAREYFARALVAFPPGHRMHGSAIQQYASVECLYANETGSCERLGAAIETVIKTEGSTQNKEDLALLQFQRSRLYASRYELLSSFGDLDESIIAAGAALANLPTASGVRPLQHELLSDLQRTTSIPQSALNTIGNMFSKKFEIVGGTENLTQALSYRRRALDMLPIDHTDKPARLHSVAILLHAHFEQYGSIHFLDESIQLDRQASEGLPHGFSVRSMVLNGLSNSLAHRYKQTGNSRDLEEAVLASRDSVKSVAKGQVSRAAYLNGLSNRLKANFQRTQAKEDLDGAIEAVTEAVASSLDQSADQYIYVITLSNCLFARYNAYRDHPDLEKSIQTCRKYLALPETNPHWMTAYHNLGIQLQWAFQDSTDDAEKRKYIEEALEIAEKCVAMTPEQHPGRPESLYQLAVRQLYFGTTMDGHTDEEIIAQMMLSASTSETAFNQAHDTPLSRINNANTAGYLYMAGKDWKREAHVLAEAVSLFRRVSPLSLDDNDRQLQLRGLSGNSSMACACYLALDDAEKALEALEAGRGIMASISMGYHADLSNVRDADASLHDKYIKLRLKLSQPLPESDENSSHCTDAVAVRNMEVAEFEALEERIRNLKGLETFNRSMSAAEMKRLASFGPIVAFCTVDQRCDAVIVTEDKIELLPLPDLRNADIKVRVGLVVGNNRLSRASGSKRAVANKKMRALLTWLWNMAVQPVLQHRGLLGDEVLPFEKNPGSAG